MSSIEKQLRSPIVVVVGHVDHGKTSLLDYIRKTNITAKEAGGITQATGAYEITHNKKKVTFIDTPGHEAFTKMRSRGAKVADLAILVVAADDGVKPQTKESIAILKEAKIPFVVAINKIDKKNADIEKVKRELGENDVLLEGYGGDISFELISAKTGENVEKLLDLILLAGEFIDLSYDSRVPAEGVVVEAELHKQRGNEVAVVIKNGVLKKGDEIFTATTKGKIKSLQTFARENVTELRPSSPALILGFESLPAVGETFSTNRDAVAKKETAKPAEKPSATEKEGEALTIILKADTAGSLEAASQILSALTYEDVGVRIWNEGVGTISDGDVKNAATTGAVIVGFNVKVDRAAEALAQNHNVRIVISKVIYELVQLTTEELKRIKIPPPLGTLEVLKIFSAKGTKQLIGGKVIEGELRNKASVDIYTGETIRGPGRVMSLKSGKQDASRVEMGKECGLMVESRVEIQVGDRVVIPAPTK